MNYKIYRLSPGELLLTIAEYALAAGLIAFLFYDSVFSLFFISPGILLYMANKRKQYIKVRNCRVKKEFSDMIMSVSTALSSGFSIENAFKESYKDMASLYGSDSLICRELSGFIGRLGLGVTLEECLLDYGNRTGIEDIKDFAEIFVMAKRNGGDFNRMITRCAETIRQKEETENEIEALLSGKKLEQKVMGVIPCIILMYLRLQTGNFLSMLYHNPSGIIIMTVCLVIYILAFYLAERITDIKV
ncbi:MAG: type II secretion system F family protein [Lachnospiraceae bacterium]|nr:type II secretion system F family protein [Lachnospiraceae bacterium]